MTVPYGAWPSPFSAARMAAGAVRLAQPEFDGDAVLWKEARPAEAGRVVIVRREPSGATSEPLPDGYSARSTFREYGGADYLPVAGGLLFANQTDQRLYLLRAGRSPVPVTPGPGCEYRYADLGLAPGGDAVYAVRESLSGGAEPVEEIVRVPLSGEAPPETVVSGSDFFAAPRCSPDGRWLSWSSWSHPHMPWDSGELWLGRLRPGDPGGPVRDARLVAGGPTESIFQPCWSPDGVLHFCSDRTGWWNLYRWRDGAAEPVFETAAEFGFPQWFTGLRGYGFLSDGAAACLVHVDGRCRLAVLRDGRCEYLDDLPYPEISPGLATNGRELAVIASAPDRPATVVQVTVPRAVPSASPVATRTQRLSEPPEIEPGYGPPARHVSFPVDDGQVHALLWLPANPAVRPAGTAPPPLIVEAHGGPTSQTLPGFFWPRLFWTSRGFAYLAVNYRGSTGYGRAYRERLNGSWGVVDAADCVTAVKHLVGTGVVDGSRVGIRGASSGGYTALRAAMTSDVFACAVSVFGVTDLALLRRHTHKFESRYLDGLVGPWPQEAARYEELSPARHAGSLRCPLLLLQGGRDKVVPPAQAERMTAVLTANRIPHAYLAFGEEGHGFRRAESIRRSFEAELAFYGRIFGFTPADELPGLELRGGDPR